MTLTLPDPRPLSVVLAVHNAAHTIGPCLETLVSQCDAAGVELVLVDNSTDGSTARIQEQAPTVRLVHAPPDDLIPMLWTRGIEASQGDAVALTTAHCIPASDWVAQMLLASQMSYPAVGGAIESAPDAALVDWAIYFCRYSRYMLPFPPHADPEPAGDNAVYQRWALDRYRAAWQHGFWEPDVHAEMRKEGYTLWRSPAPVIYHKQSFTMRGFIRNRFWHGRQFGSSRAAPLGWPTRLLHLLRAPLIPAVLLARVGQAVIQKRRHRAQFLRTLPLLTLFYVCWAFGETTGYFTAPPSDDQAAPLSS